MIVETRRSLLQESKEPKKRDNLTECETEELEKRKQTSEIDERQSPASSH